MALGLLSSCGDGRPRSGGGTPSPTATPTPPAGDDVTDEGWLAIAEGEGLLAKASAGSSREYPLELELGHYLHAVVEQLGVDVTVSVYGPAGHRLLSVDSPTGTSGDEHVFFSTASPGLHQLTVRAPSNAEPGQYRLRVEARRPADDEDLLRAAAASAYSRARELHGTSGAGTEAVADKYQEAADLWGELGENSRQAMALYRLGRLCRTSDPDKATRALHDARELYRQLGDERREALTLYHLGQARESLGDLATAGACYERSLKLWQRLGVAAEEAARANNLAEIRRLQGHAHEGIELSYQALDLWRRLGALRDQATTLTNLGISYAALGEYRTALDLYRQALDLLDEVDDPGQRAITLSKLGDALLWLDGPRDALEPYLEALRLRRQEHNVRGEAITLNSIALAQVAAQRPRQALVSYRQAVEILHRLGDLRAEAVVRANLAHAHERLGHRRQARETYRDALELARRAPHPQTEAGALFGLARLSGAEGHLSDAESLMRDSLEVVESIREQARRPDLRSSFLASRQDYYDYLVELLARRHLREPRAGHSARAFAASERARARSLLDALIASGKRQPRDPETSGRLGKIGEEINARHLDGWPPDTPGQAAGRDPELLLLMESYRQEAAELRRIPAVDVEELRLLTLGETQTDLLDDGTLLLEYHLGPERSFLWAVTRSEARFVDDLPGREAIEAKARRTYRRMVESHYQTGGVAAVQAAVDLSRVLLEPVADLLHHPRLAIVAPGALQYVPFAALPHPRFSASGGPPTPLVAEHEIIHLPSVSVLAALRRRLAGRKPPPGLLAVLADPVLDPEDERLAGVSIENAHGARRGHDRRRASAAPPALRRLEYTRREAEAILEVAGEGPKLSALGFEARRELVESGRLQDFRILHFATHGVFDAEHPELSSIVLSSFDGRGRPIDGLLRSYEIFQLDLPVELVVLSACRTAMGEEVRGEGLVGLTRSFLHAGARRVLVSLWDVNDRATAALMGHYYRALLHDDLPPARALREAQLAVGDEKRWRSPFYWAGFVLYGEWQ